MSIEIAGIGIVAAFLAGAISFLSPCVLPLVPGYVSFIAGQTDQAPEQRAEFTARLRAVGLSLCFVLGFSTVFVILGAGVGVLGRVLLSWRNELSMVGGAIIVVFGLSMLGVLRFGALLRDTRFHLDLPSGRPWGAYLLGLAFAFGWTPCIGPILGAILTVGATSTRPTEGIWLLSIYSAGLGVPFLITALFTDTIARRIGAIGRAGRLLYKLAGAVMVLMGIAIMTGQLTRFAYWLLVTFPVLGRIG